MRPASVITASAFNANDGTERALDRDMGFVTNVHVLF